MCVHLKRREYERKKMLVIEYVRAKIIWATIYVM
jgi:hypothetical protein